MRKRPWRFLKIVALVIVVSLLELTTWVLHVASEGVHRLVRFIGLGGLEQWLKRQPTWFAVTLIVAMFLGSWVFKVYELRLMFSGRLITALSLAAVFKILWLGVMNYLLHLYGELFLAVSWIRYAYEWYGRIKRYVYDIIERTAAYRIVRRFKTKLRMIKVGKTLRTASRMARRSRT